MLNTAPAVCFYNSVDKIIEANDPLRKKLLKLEGDDIHGLSVLIWRESYLLNQDLIMPQHFRKEIALERIKQSYESVFETLSDKYEVFYKHEPFNPVKTETEKYMFRRLRERVFDSIKEYDVQANELGKAFHQEQSILLSLRVVPPTQFYPAFSWEVW